MNIGELKALIDGLPNETPVVYYLEDTKNLVGHAEASVETLYRKGSYVSTHIVGEVKRSDSKATAFEALVFLPQFS